MDNALIYDWNQDQPPPRPPAVILNDETLRDGLQSPSVRAPSIDQKLGILHLLDQIGIDTADTNPADRATCCRSGTKAISSSRSFTHRTMPSS